MIDIEPGQHVVVASGWQSGCYTVIRADQVTAKQVRSRCMGNRYSRTERHLVVFAGTNDKAELVAEALNLAVDQRDARERVSRDQFKADCEPFRLAHEARVTASREQFAADRRTVLEAAGVQVPA